MRKINKIVLSVCCVAASAVMIYVSKQRKMVSDIISNNVEALVAGDPGSSDICDPHPMYVFDHDNTNNNSETGYYWGYYVKNGESVYCAKDPAKPMCAGQGYSTTTKYTDGNGNQRYCYW